MPGILRGAKLAVVLDEPVRTLLSESGSGLNITCSRWRMIIWRFFLQLLLLIKKLKCYARYRRTEFVHLRSDIQRPVAHHLFAMIMAATIDKSLRVAIVAGSAFFWVILGRALKMSQFKQATLLPNSARIYNPKQLHCPVPCNRYQYGLLCNTRTLLCAGKYLLKRIRPTSQNFFLAKVDSLLHE